MSKGEIFIYSLSLTYISILEIILLPGNHLHQDVNTNSTRHSKIVSKHCLISLGGGSQQEQKNPSYKTRQMPLMSNDFLAISYRQVIVYCAFPLSFWDISKIKMDCMHFFKVDEEKGGKQKPVIIRKHAHFILFSKFNSMLLLHKTLVPFSPQFWWVRFSLQDT